MRETCRHDSQNQVDKADREKLSWKLYVGFFITWFLINSVINKVLLLAILTLMTAIFHKNEFSKISLFIKQNF